MLEKGCHELHSHRSLEPLGTDQQEGDVTPNFALGNSRVKQQFQVFAGLSLGIAAFSELGYLSDQHLFQNYFGLLHPLLVIFLLVVLGFLLLFFLISQHFFVIFSRTTLKECAIGFVLAACFAFIAILVDVNVKFPKGMNILFPESLLFYPVIGFCVEIVFHVLPLSILILIFSRFFRQTQKPRMLWLSIAIVSLFEPVFQAVSGFSAKVPDWVLVWTGVHVFLINLVQLMIFKRNGFVWMYLFRLAYYVFWHVAWGYFRLRVLF
jgi:hypothetical protein